MHISLYTSVGNAWQCEAGLHGRRFSFASPVLHTRPVLTTLLTQISILKSRPSLGEKCETLIF